MFWHSADYVSVFMLSTGMCFSCHLRMSAFLCCMRSVYRWFVNSDYSVYKYQDDPEITHTKVGLTNSMLYRLQSQWYVIWLPNFVCFWSSCLWDLSFKNHGNLSLYLMTISNLQETKLSEPMLEKEVTEEPVPAAMFAWMALRRLQFTVIFSAKMASTLQSIGPTNAPPAEWNWRGKTAFTECTFQLWIKSELLNAIES